MKKLLLIISLIVTTHQLYSNSICTILNTPGLLVPGGDVVLDPTDPNDSGYCIESSDVTIDFGGFNISQDNAVTVPGFNCITVSPGLSNITIRNGTIQNMSGIGIRIGEGCTNINIENINVIGCYETGILLNGTSISTIQDGSISNCLIYSCTGANGNPAYGLRLIYSDNFDVSYCTCNKNDAGTSSSGYGISLEWCNSCNLTNCSVDSNGGMDLGAGYNIYNSQWCNIQNCNALNTIARNNDPATAVGFLIDTSGYTTIESCISKHANNVVAQAYAFKATNGIDNLFINCDASQSIGGTQSAGFYFNNTETASSLFTSQSRANNGGTSGKGYGILLDTAQNCNICGNFVLNNTGLQGYGLSDSVVNTTNLIARTISFNNITTGYQVSRTVGAFPVVTASLGDFSTTATHGPYVNIDFIQ